MNKTYLITYTLYFTDGRHRDGKMKVHNCFNELHAKIKLDGYLQKKHPVTFSNLIIHSCFDDTIGIFSIFNDIFK